MIISRPITIIIPVYNAASTLPSLFTTLEKQKSKNLIRQLIFVEDKSTDNSRLLLINYSKISSYDIKIINHNQNRGLANNYNEGIRNARTPLFILMHDDIKIITTDAFQQTINLFHQYPKLFCAYPHSSLPRSLFNKYNFWQKILFSRHVGKEITYFCGKFDCYRRSLFTKEIHHFNSKIFRSAGEDADIISRLKRKNLFVLASPVRLVHLHSYDSNFSPLRVIFKEAQIAEGQGANLRLNNIDHLKSFILTFFRPLILLALLIPYIQYLAIITIVVYAFWYTRLVYLIEWKNPRILLLPFFNIFLLFVGAGFALKGFISGRQEL